MSRGRPFEPGNTFGKGRPQGSKNKGKSAARRLLEKYEESLMLKIINEGMHGNIKALMWCLNQLNRLLPRATKLKFGQLKTVDDVAKALGDVLNAVANHDRTAADGHALMNTLGEIRRTIETQELAARLEALEALAKKNGGK